MWLNVWNPWPSLLSHDQSQSVEKWGVGKYTISNTQWPSLPKARTHSRWKIAEYPNRQSPEAVALWFLGPNGCLVGNYAVSQRVWVLVLITSESLAVLRAYIGLGWYIEKWRDMISGNICIIWWKYFVESTICVFHILSLAAAAICLVLCNGATDHSVGFLSLRTPPTESILNSNGATHITIMVQKKCTIPHKTIPQMGDSWCCSGFWHISLFAYTPSYDIILKKIAFCIANISDNSTKTILLYSPSSPPSSELKSIIVAPLLLKLAYLATFFFSGDAHC